MKCSRCEEKSRVIKRWSSDFKNKYNFFSKPHYFRVFYVMHVCDNCYNIWLTSNYKQIKEDLFITTP